MHRWQIALATAMLLGLADPAFATSAQLPRARPEDVGMSSDRLARLDSAVQRLVEGQDVAGVVALVARRGQICTPKQPFLFVRWETLSIRRPTAKHDTRLGAFLVEGEEWRVYELAPTFDRRHPSLVFESDTSIRRVRSYPADWRTLSDDELFTLSWNA